MRLILFVLSALVIGQNLLTHGMPTVENVAKHLGSRSVGLEQRSGQGCPYQELQDQLQKRKEKRLLLDPLTTPIDGMLAEAGNWGS